jgi:uncharacterized protein YciI
MIHAPGHEREDQTAAIRDRAFRRAFAMNRYLVMVMRHPHFDPAVVPRHRAFLDDLQAQERIVLRGPFGDGSGGAYLLRAGSLDEARAIAQRDPTHTSGGWQVTVYEWQC